MIATLGQDFRYALRQLRKSPGFTAVTVVTLALGIGANTAIFSIVEGVVLAPLHYFQPDRLVMVWENNPRFPRVWNSYPNFQDWQRTAQSFQQMAAFRQQGGDLTSPGAPSHLKASQISLGFFSTLGAELALGREFTPQESQPGGARAAVISNQLWRERFGGSSEALGKTVTVDGVNYSIVGVAPPGFRVNDDAAVYTPLGQLDSLVLNNRGSHDGIFSFARLKPGVSISQSQAEMSTIQNRLDRLYPDDNRDLGIYVEPLKQAIIGDSGQTLALLLGAVGLVLLIACANIATLLLARSAARSREFAIRSALGANRARLARQLLTESVILSLSGACLGSLIAFFGIRSVLAAMPGILPRSENVSVNGPVLLYTLIVSLVVGVLFGLAPALKSWSADPQMSLKERGRGSTVHRRTQSSFVVVQVASTLVLLVGAGLLLRTIFNLWNVNPGFDTRNIIALKVGVSHSLTRTPSSTRVAYEQLIERIHQIPGVEAADFTTAVPLSGQGGYLPFWLDSHKPESVQGAPRMGWFLTGPDYLRTMGMRLLQGRFLSEDDDTKSPCVAVIDSNFARKFFPDGKPIGHTITAGFAAFGPCVIVGVVNHVKYAGLDDSGPANQYQAYYSLYQDPDQWVPLNYPDASIIVRTPLDATTLIPAINQSSSEQPIYNVQTIQQIISASMSEQRFPMILLGAFAGLALLLASVGIYGMISYSVTQRVQEIGIRMALGADKGKVLRLFVGQELKLVLSGTAVGAVGALILTRTLSSLSHLLYGVGSGDPLTFATTSIVLIAVAALAGYIPARRAAKVDPMVALRYE
jgi:putative ABC transport system permease protein